MGGCSGCGKRAAMLSGAPGAAAYTGGAAGMALDNGAAPAPAPMAPLSFWEQVEACVRENPWLAILAALVIGAAIGRSK